MIRNVLIMIALMVGVAANTHAESFSQRDTIINSCLLSNSKYFPPKEEHTEMCLALKFKPFMPYMPTDWQTLDINWLIKSRDGHQPFREGREMRGMFGNYNIYPFIKYFRDTEKIYMMGTADKVKVAALQAKWPPILEKRESAKKGEIADDTIYFLDYKKRFSPFDMEKQWKMAHISVKDKAYLIVYLENLKDLDMMHDFIRSINYEGIKEFAGTVAGEVNGQQSPIQLKLE